MKPTRKNKLFIISGASCIGKSTACEILFRNEKDYKEELVERMKYGRKVTDENWIKSSEHFNEWLKNNAEKTTPNIILIDNTYLSPEETAERIDQVIRLNMG